jgi:PST family polysaccharide transporter/lipopolysaccharide exporter
MAIVLSAASVVQSFMEIGVKEGLIQDPNGSEDQYVNAAWWMSVGRAAALAAILFVLAPFAARFYGDAEIAALLRLSTVGIVLGGALSPRAYVAIKEMKFGKWTVITNGGGICGVAITLTLSLFIRDVWALMIGSCAENASRCVLSYILCPHLPSLGWDKEAARNLMRFSKGVFGLSFLNFIFSRADIFVLAKLFPPATLGVYTMAVCLVQNPTSFVMNTLGQTLLPAFSRVRADPRRVNRILIQVTSLIALATLPALAFVLFCGRSLLGLTYGLRYGSVAGSLLAASAVGAVNLLNGQLTTVFYAHGLPEFHRRSVAVMAVTMVVVVYPLCRWMGPVGGQVAALLAVMAGYGLQAERVRELTGIKLIDYGQGLWLSGLVSMVVVAAGLCARLFAVAALPAANIAIGAAACLVAYLLACAVLLRGRRDVLRPARTEP